MFQNKRLPKYIVTRNGAGSLCAVITNSNMQKGMSGTVSIGNSGKMFPEIQWPHAWKLVRCHAKDAVLRIGAMGVVSVWLRKEGMWLDTGTHACISRGLYYLEYVKDGG